MPKLHPFGPRLPRGAKIGLVAPLVAFALLGASTATLTDAPTWRATFALDLGRLFGPVPALTAPPARAIAAGETIATAPASTPVWLPPPTPRAPGVMPERRELRLAIPYADEIRRVARRHAIDELLLASLVEVESGFRPDAVSSRGALGLMQLMPSVAEHYGLEEVFAVEPNLDAGASYFKDLERRFDGDAERALGAYFAGPTKIARQGADAPAGEARRYVDRVLAVYSRHCREGGDAEANAELRQAAVRRAPVSAAAGAR